MIGALAAAVEIVPHRFVASETSALASGGSTPITDTHLALQALLLPVYGVAIANFAWRGFGRVAHPAACVLGVVGGAALTVVGPLLVATDEPSLGAVFMPGAGTFLFVIATGVRLIRHRDAARSLVAA